MPKTITLEVTERQAAALLVADHLGKIQLALRGQPQDPDAAPERHRIVWASDVSTALRAAARRRHIAGHCQRDTQQP